MPGPKEELSSLISLIFKENFKTRFYELSKEKNIAGLKEFFYDLKEINSSHINLARETLTENFLAAWDKATNKSDWEYKFGAEAMVYCGRYIRYIGEDIKALARKTPYYKREKIKKSCSILVDDLTNEANEYAKTPKELDEIAQALKLIREINSEYC